MKQSELNKILRLHKMWLNDGNGGVRADLQDANLRYANLQDANLRYVDLRYADLRDVDLWGADLRGADLRGADLRGADLDFSCLPIWCGGLNFKIDEKQAKQLMYHVINLMQHSGLDTNKLVKVKMYDWLSDSHLVTKHDLPILERKIK